MKNKKVLLVVFGLLIGVSISFAYFVGRSLTSGSGASLTVKTATLNGTKMKVEGELSFNDEFIYPGHTKVSSIKVTATGNNELIPYNLIWKGINSLYTSLNYKVYKSDKKIEVEASCEKKREIVDGKQLLHEVCNINNLQELGKEIYTGTIERSENNTKIILAEDEYITSTEEGKEVYYYVVIEYPNTEDIENNQNQDIGNTFSGEVTVEKSETNADINIMAVYVADENGNYKRQEDGKVPEEIKYSLDLKKSECSNDATLSWNRYTKQLTINNFNKEGTKCYLYYKELSAKDTLKKFPSLTLSENGCPAIDENTGEVTEALPNETSADLLCQAKDNDGVTYYFRGVPTKNWVKIDKTYWQIVRINGDGSIRLIYNGSSTNRKASDTVVTTVTNKKYNDSSNDNAYVGFMYGKTSSSSYDEAHANTTPSNILQELKKWYEGNELPEKAKTDYIDGNAGFCNDRTPYANASGGTPNKNGYGFGSSGTTYYGAYVRITTNKIPSFKCSQKNDLFTTPGSEKGNQILKVDNVNVPVGLITADEVMFAGGGFGSSSYINRNYYLYNNQYYWTMSPYIFSGSSAQVFFVVDSGYLSLAGVTDTRLGLRPVINLKADTPFIEGGEGTTSNPFVVKID